MSFGTNFDEGYNGISISRYANPVSYTHLEDVMNSPKRQNSVNLGAGDIKYYDFNGDGIIDGNDQHRIGKNSSFNLKYRVVNFNRVK